MLWRHGICKMALTTSRWEHVGERQKGGGWETTNDEILSEKNYFLSIFGKVQNRNK